jgi:hypothetical protein
LQNDHHQKWSTYLQQFDINIKYKTWSSNRVVDFLIQRPVDALTTMFHSCGNEASQCPQLYQKYLDLTSNYYILGIGTNVTYFHIQDALLCHLGHLCVPTSECAKMIWEAHYSQVAGHFGMEKIVVVLQKLFYWPKLRHDVSKYIIYCIACVISKSSINNKGLYTPLLTPERPWESISMDYMFGLPSTKKVNDYIFVVVNRFSNMTILTTYKKSITLEDTANILFK